MEFGAFMPKHLTSDGNSFIDWTKTVWLITTPWIAWGSRDPPDPLWLLACMSQQKLKQCRKWCQKDKGHSHWGMTIWKSFLAHIFFTSGSVNVRQKPHDPKSFIKYISTAEMRVFLYGLLALHIPPFSHLVLTLLCCGYIIIICNFVHNNYQLPICNWFQALVATEWHTVLLCYYHRSCLCTCVCLYLKWFIQLFGYPATTVKWNWVSLLCRLLLQTPVEEWSEREATRTKRKRRRSTRCARQLIRAEVDSWKRNSSL